MNPNRKVGCGTSSSTHSAGRGYIRFTSAGLLLVAGVLPASCQVSDRRSFLALVGPLFARGCQASESRGLGCSAQEMWSGRDRFHVRRDYVQS